MLDRYFLYFPTRAFTAIPSDAGVPYEDVWFRSEDGFRLHGWLVRGSGKLVLLWCHGNAGNVSDRVPLLKLFHERLGGTHFVFDYRGYGSSSGAPSEQGLYRDARAALDALAEAAGVDPSDVVVYGHSLGAAVALDAAVARTPRALVLESAFTSIRDMARIHYRRLPARPLVRARFDSIGKVGRLRCPALFLHGQQDDIVPVRLGRALFDAAPEPKHMEIFPEAGHDDVPLAQDCFRALRAFLERFG